MTAIIRVKRPREDDVAESFSNVAKRLKWGPSVDVRGFYESIKFAGTVAVQEDCFNLVTQAIATKEVLPAVNTISNDPAVASSSPAVTSPQYRLIDVESSTNKKATETGSSSNYVYDTYYIDSEKYWGVEFSLCNEIEFFEEPRGGSDDEENEAQNGCDEDLDDENNFQTQYPEDDYEIGSAAYVPSFSRSRPGRVSDTESDKTDSDGTDSDGEKYDDDDDSGEETKNPVKQDRLSRLDDILKRCRRDL